MTKWRCEQCGYLLSEETPPEECPSCHVKCTFLDVTPYSPDKKFEGEDNRIKPKPDSAPIHK